MRPPFPAWMPAFLQAVAQGLAKLVDATSRLLARPG